MRITHNAVEKAQLDFLTFDVILFNELSVEMIEHYPDDKRYPSCLIHGKTFRQEPVQGIRAFNETNLWAVQITVYPPFRWIDWRVRRAIN